MKILQIFNRYSYLGGEEIAVAQISEELAAHHKFRAVTFDSQEWANESGMSSRVRQFLAMAWNPQSLRIVREEIRVFQPDLILLHNIMPVGSAALFVYLAGCGVPVVQYIHNFRPFSVNGYCWGQGRLLPQGLRKNFLPEVMAGSWQNSRFKTAWYAVLIRALHIIGVYQRIDGWIAISQFMKDSFVVGGIEEDRIKVLAHSWQPRLSGADSPASSSVADEPVFLFLGRLTEEKGLRVLLDAWDAVEAISERGRLVIAGDGPLVDEVAGRCGRMRRATYAGFQSGEAKQQLLAQCTALVVPSIWWEPLGLVLYEAYDHAKPVIAARSGGIVDHVEDGVTGWLHEPGDVRTLTAQIAEAIENSELCRTRGAAGRELLLERTTKLWIQRFDEFANETLARRSGSFTPSGEVLPPPAASAGGAVPTSQAGLVVSTYLADQNPGHDRSFGISRMSRLILQTLQTGGGVSLRTIASETSQQAPTGVGDARILPWGTRRKWVRLLTDHFYPLFANRGDSAGVHYFPKGYLPLLSGLCRPSVVTIHDTIIQYDEDRYPDWRSRWEYSYWSWMLKHTLRRADVVLTVSESAKNQIQAFMDRYRIAPKEITVTYEPCIYEALPQPVEPKKKNYVIHLASCEPHKRTAYLIRWWCEAEARGADLPMLHLIGTAPAEVHELLASSCSIVKLPFLEEGALQAAYQAARALILPSEIEGFGLPALEAYYLGTPVCFVRGTSVEEVLSVATSKGGFRLEDLESLETALAEVMAMTEAEVRDCGLKLRETYAAEKVVARMLAVFEKTGKR